MDDVPNTELISAYFDGEVTPSERELVERWLRESEEANGDLEEIRELSGLIRSETIPAPEGLRSEILSRLERESVPETVTRTTVPPSRDSGHVVWLSAAAGLAASAAVVLMSVHFLGDVPNGPEPTGDRSVAETPAPTLPAEVAEARDALPGERGRGVPGAPGFEHIDVPAPAPKPAIVADLAKAPAPQPGELGQGTDDDGLSPAEKERAERLVARKSGEGGFENRNKPSDPGTKLRERLEFDDDLSVARVGDVVRALETRDGEVAVVRLTVVDRRAGLEALQLLLARNDVALGSARPSDEYSTSDDVPESDAGGEGGELGSRSDAVEAVFVEATSEQLVSTLNAMNEFATFRTVDVERPVELAGLETFNRRRGQGSALSDRAKGSATGGESREFASLDSATRAEEGRQRELATVRGKKHVPDAKAEGKIAGLRNSDRKPLDPAPGDGVAATRPERPVEPEPAASPLPPAPNGPEQRPGLDPTDRIARSPDPEPNQDFRGDKRALDEFARLAQSRQAKSRQAKSRQANLLVPRELADGRRFVRAELGDAEQEAIERTEGSLGASAPGAQADPLAAKPVVGGPPVPVPNRLGGRGGHDGASRASIPPTPPGDYRRRSRLSVVFVLVTASGEPLEATSEPGS